MNKYDKEKDLARILIEGTKAVYGPEKAEQVKTEFERQRKLPVYRGSADELTAIVDRVFDGKIIETPVVESNIVEAKAVESIDDAVDMVEYQQPKPNILRVAVKGTLNLVNKTCWYYHILGALPGKYQEKIAGRLGDNSDYYTKSNMVAELVGASALGYSVNGISGAAAGGAISIVHSFLRWLSVSVGWTAGSALITLPMYTTLYSIVAVKVAGKTLRNAVIESYASALQQEQQKILLLPKKKRKKKKMRVVEQKQESVMTPDGEKVVEESEEESEEEPGQKKDYIKAKSLSPG